MKSYKQLPAQTIKHYGKYDDELPNDHFSYGKPTLDSYHVNDIFEGNGENTGFDALVTQIKENKYASHKLLVYSIFYLTILENHWQNPSPETTNSLNESTTPISPTETKPTSMIMSQRTS